MNALDGRAIEREVMAGLKAFQRTTVDHVFHELYERPDPTNRFLVADEVGLGKTLVARGVIAKTIRHLQETGTRRIDIVYICSNGAIAEQNIRRLNVTGDAAFERPTRITLLPRQVHALDNNALNFVSLTPGTSFQMGDRAGRSDERTVLYRLLQHALGRRFPRAGAARTLRGTMAEANFVAAVERTPRVGARGVDRLDPGLAERYREELEAHPALIERFRWLADRLRTRDRDELRHDRHELVRDLRLALARSCVEALEPDLVILDEFQRFRELLDPPDPEDPDDIRHLVHHLYGQRDRSTGERARVLLLSATPYRMYTLRDEADEDHYADFQRTVRFLLGADEARAFADDLRAFRQGLLELGSGEMASLLEHKARIERRLRRVIVRTERLAVTETRSGMLADVPMAADAIGPGDIRGFASIDRMSRVVRGGDVADYWKSSPYLLSYLRGYQVRTHLEAAADDPAIVAALDPGTSLSRSALDGYEPVDPGNARLRALAAETVAADAWRLLWVPPSLPYYAGRGAWATEGAGRFTKRLLFSSWNLVPDAVSTLLSYEAERQMMLTRDPDATRLREDRARLRGLLAIRRGESGAPGGMSTFALVFPSIALAELGDPLAIAAGLRSAGNPAPTADDVVAEARRCIADALAPIVRGAWTEGPEDLRWYALAPLLLDRAHATRAATAGWLGSRSTTLLDPGTADGIGAGQDDVDAWGDHVRLALQVVNDGPPDALGRVPSDLADALADLAVGAPGVCALRALARVVARVGGTTADRTAFATRDAALRIGWGFRTLYNLPEVMSLLRGASDGDDAYWRRVAVEGVHGNLQAVLDEYVHLLPEWLGRMDRDTTGLALRIAQEIHDAVSLKAVTYRPDEARLEEGRLTFSSLSMRVRFAVRFGRGSGEEDAELDRTAAVRSAFNSPFWPFVLTSTSVGQEGLDFHLYCHAIVHWNLPANPVDLEQREGRVHRYKGHAVRRNVAATHARAAFDAGGGDAWDALFRDAAATVTDDRLRDIVPFWVYEGPATIERHVPLMPLSREVEQLRRLRASLAAYRLVFGQPRQEDLLAYLGDRISREELARISDALRIDLTPGG